MAGQRKKASRSSRIWKVAVVSLMVVLVIMVFARKQKEIPQESLSAEVKKPSQYQDSDASRTAGLDDEVTVEKTTRSQSRLPRLVDLGADKCIPCKMMAPILEGLKEEYEGRLQVEFIDVWKDPKAGRQYGIRVIPTQIFYDTDGKEFYRHVGFFSKEDILKVFREKGINLNEA